MQIILRIRYSKATPIRHLTLRELGLTLVNVAGEDIEPDLSMSVTEVMNLLQI